jgi:hypothetical protein
MIDELLQPQIMVSSDDRNVSSYVRRFWTLQSPEVSPSLLDKYISTFRRVFVSPSSGSSSPMVGLHPEDGGIVIIWNVSNFTQRHSATSRMSIYVIYLTLCDKVEANHRARPESQKWPLCPVSRSTDSLTSPTGMAVTQARSCKTENKSVKQNEISG